MKLPKFLRGSRHLHGHGRIVHHSAAIAPSKLLKRWAWYMSPQRFKDFWFTREGKRAALRIAGFAAGTVFILIAGVFLFFAKDLPSPGKVNSLTQKQTTRFYDRSGQHLLYQVYGDENRSVVELDQIAKPMQQATIAVEDKDFYHHGAFSSVGILRAAFNNLFHRDTGIQGGSTITQQYVKKALLTDERTLSRKVKELILSIQIEQLYGKDDILGLYLNEIPYGTQAYGAQAAAKTFFDKDAKDLTLDEAATLAALPRAPTYYSPYGQHTDELIERRDLILGLMKDQGYISQEQLDQAKAVDTIAKVNQSPNLYADIKAPWFVLHAQEVLEEKLGTKQVTEGGLEVITTLDWEKQQMAEQAMAEGISAVDRAGGNNAALVAGDPNTGQILALVGGRDFRNPQFGTFNAATARRQPGSSFKPYVYVTGFKTSNWGPGSVMYDVPTDFGGYRPNNYDNRFHGVFTIRDALAGSWNIPAVKMLYIVGVQNALNTAHDVGITTLQDPSQYGLSLVLGAGEVKLIDHVNGFESFSNGGMHYDQTPILKVTDPKGNVVTDNSHPQGKRVLDAQAVYMIQSILTDDAARSRTFGRNNPNIVYPGHTLGVKTGTTDSNKDGWMMGFSKDLTAGVWAGHTQNKPMSGISDRISGPIFRAFWKRAFEGQPDKPFEQPAGIKKVALDNNTGTLPGQGSKGTHTDIFPAWYSPKPAPAPQNATIDKVSGKLATDCTPPLARQAVTGVGITAEIPSTDPAFGRWNPPVQQLAASLGYGQGGTVPTEKDDKHQCSDVKPTVSLSANPAHAGPGSTITLTAQVTKGTGDLDRLDFKLDGQPIGAQGLPGSGTYTHTYQVPAGASGSHTFTAEVLDKLLYTSEAASAPATFASNGSSPRTAARRGLGIFPFVPSFFRRAAAI